MLQVLVACRTGMGSSMMLKIKVEQVVRENNWDIEVEHNEISAAKYFGGDILITMEDLADEFKGNNYDVIGIKNLMNKEEIREKLAEYISNK